MHVQSLNLLLMQERHSIEHPERLEPRQVFNTKALMKLL